MSSVSLTGSLRVGTLVTGNTLLHGVGTILGKHGKVLLLSFLIPTLPSLKWRRHAKDGGEISEVLPNTVLIPCLKHNPTRCTNETETNINQKRVLLAKVQPPSLGA